MMKLKTLFLYCVGLALSNFCSLESQANPIQENCNDNLKPIGAYYTNEYQNLFNEYLGISQKQTDQRIGEIWNHFFVNENTKVYYESDDTTAYIYDTGNRDVRSEGMSYGMMICVQFNKQAEFDKLWRWAKKHMLYSSGKRSGYFAWQCKTNGVKLGGEPSCAPDGEIYFITSLFFASHRWGDDGVYNYNEEAQKILKDIMSKDGSQGVYNMFNANSKLVTFVPEREMYEYTDPSYNLPAFFELWALWTDTNKEFWAQTADASRRLLVNASHKRTGLFPDYSSFDGAPLQPLWKRDYDARRYQYDAIRCAMNIGMDYYWFGKDADNQTEMMTRLLNFFKNNKFTHGQFNLDGSEPTGGYTEGMAGANAVGTFALKDKELAKEYLQHLWDMPLPIGKFRYYSGMVYMLSMLHVSGNFRIFK